ncbi:MAG: hypothetical protein HQL41_06575 [Alphaproteobacteria bacterium]|nr:hypothetical protein [Alphaproteobacteria bacterium]
MTLLSERAVNGMVSLTEVQRIVALLERGTVSLDDAFRRHETLCRAEFGRPKGNVGARSNPFQRLSVRPFEHLLMGDGAVFDRAHLPNYFDYVDVALGDRKPEFDSQSKAIIQALLVIHGNSLTWELFYADPRTLAVLGRALAILTDERHLGAWKSLMARPVGENGAPAPEGVEQIHAALVRTRQGLDSSG